MLCLLNVICWRFTNPDFLGLCFQRSYIHAASKDEGTPVAKEIRIDVNIPPVSADASIIVEGLETVAPLGGAASLRNAAKSGSVNFNQMEFGYFTQGANCYCFIRPFSRFKWRVDRQ